MAAMRRRLDSGQTTDCPCPLCQLMTSVRTTHPEMADHLGEAASAMMTLARDLFSPSSHRAPGQQTSGPGPSSPASAADFVDIPVDEDPAPN